MTKQINTSCQRVIERIMLKQTVPLAMYRSYLYAYQVYTSSMFILAFRLCDDDGEENHPVPTHCLDGCMYGYMAVRKFDSHVCIRRVMTGIPSIPSHDVFVASHVQPQLRGSVR